MQNSWDQQPKESSRAFAVFVAYRDLGLRRSCHAVAQQLNLNPSSALRIIKAPPLARTRKGMGFSRRSANPKRPARSRQNHEEAADSFSLKGAKSGWEGA